MASHRTLSVIHAELVRACGAFARIRDASFTGVEIRRDIDMNLAREQASVHRVVTGHDSPHEVPELFRHPR